MGLGERIERLAVVLGILATWTGASVFGDGLRLAGVVGLVPSLGTGLLQVVEEVKGGHSAYLGVSDRFKWVRGVITIVNIIGLVCSMALNFIHSPSSFSRM